MATTPRDSARTSISVLERQSAELIQRVERDTTDAERTRKPSIDAWSLTEVTQHLALVVGGILRTARPARRAAFLGGAKVALLNGVLRSPLKMPAPVSAVVPRPGVTWSDARRNILSSLESWKTFIDGDTFDTTRFHHPLVGSLTPAQTAQFLVEHFGHHRRQTDRLFTDLDARRSIERGNDER